MKHLRLLPILLLVMLLSSCINWGADDEIPFMPNQSLAFDAVIMPRAEFEDAVELLSAQPVVKSGKIYVNGDLLFVNDVNKGFHVYNYSDPTTPLPVAFINIPGATDLAMRDNVLFINQATDLVTLTYNASQNTIAVTKRNRNVFPQKMSPDNFWEDVSEDEVIVDWVQL